MEFTFAGPRSETEQVKLSRRVEFVRLTALLVAGLSTYLHLYFEVQWCV